MIKLTTLCPKFATVLALSVLIANTVLAQEPASIFQGMPSLEPQLESRLTVPDSPEDFIADDLNVLTRGPLHEAFASAHQAEPQASELIFKAPPDLIDEVSPEYKPDGNNVQWISGYWAWDDAQSDFIWISGIWRDVPPNRRWMPGYWDNEGSGHRWVSGFWTEETQLELGYLPEPPASIDQGPSTTAPSEDHFYVPGNWQFEGQDNRYRWLAGHWQPVVENWIWVPSRYVWTPNGCVYQSGYWDYEFESRGTCFAPVHFTQPVYLAQNYSYRPSYTINLNIDFMTHLFVRPRCGHYFYGDWYASNFNNVSYRPWVSYNSHFRSYDPLLTYYRCRRSSFDSRYNVVQYLARQHNFYTNNRDYRPRPTYKSQHKHARNISHRNGSRGHGKDYIHKSSYVRSYKDHRKHDEQRRRQTVDVRRQHDQQKHRTKKHRKVAEEELRNNRRRVEQHAELQRERKRREHDAKNRVAKSNSSGKKRMQNIPSTREREQERLRKAKDRSRQTAANDQRRSRQQAQTTIGKKKSSERRTQGKDSSRQTQSSKRQPNAKHTAQLEQMRRAQQEKARRSQQEQARRAQQENARRSQQQTARNTASRKPSSKARTRTSSTANQREQAARKAQQDIARSQ